LRLCSLSGDRGNAFREWDAWSIEHEGKAFRSVVPSPDNPRKRVLLEALKKNTR